MYAVVGCTECDMLWVVETGVETTGCPRCGTRHQFDRLKQFITTESASVARAARAAFLADRHDETGELNFEAMADADEREVVPDDEYLAKAGIDPAEVAAVEDGNRGSRSHRAVVEAAIRDLATPTEAAVVDYAAAEGVPEDRVTSLLERLEHAGDVTCRDGIYRVL